jgi:hypothetical protein
MSRRSLTLLVTALLACACGGGSRETGGPSAADATDARSDGAAAPDTGEAPPPPDAGDAGRPPCPSGSTLLADRRACPGTPPPAPLALTSDARRLSRGKIITLGGLDESSAPCMPAVLCTPDGASTLLFSDSPESPSRDGVLYADTVKPGAYRIYVYHTNGGAAPRRFSVVALNQGAAPATITVERRGLAAPSKTYIQAGKLALEEWLRATQPRTVTVPPGTRVVVDPDLDAMTAQKDELVHAIEDVLVDAPLKISVVTVAPGADTAAVTASLPLLSRDGHDRGTFPNADVLVAPTMTADPAGVRRLRFGGNGTDFDLTGTDATTGEQVKLLGNFGVRYDIYLPNTGARFAAGVSPRGSTWGGVARITPGEDSTSDLVRLPDAQEALGTTTEAVLLGRFVPAGIPPWFRLVTAGGSNLPIDVFFVAL